MTFWRNVLPNMLLQGQNAVLVVKKTLQNFYQCGAGLCPWPAWSALNQNKQIYTMHSSNGNLSSEAPFEECMAENVSSQRILPSYTLQNLNGLKRSFLTKK